MSTINNKEAKKNRKWVTIKMAKESEITISPSTSAGTYPRGFSFKKSTQHNMY